MQLFVLHRDPIENAKLHCDQDCVDMVVRCAAALSTVHVQFNSARYDPLSESWLLNLNDRAIYPPKSIGDPWVAWVCATAENYRWTRRLLEGFLMEYQRRYGDDKGKRHRTWDQLKMLHHAPDKLVDFTNGRPYAMTAWPDVPANQHPRLEGLMGIRDPIARYRCYYRNITSPNDWREGRPPEFR